ncbi:MAG TPA: hypothetical protein VE987_17790 [Polyangiaceae bacterium]|nr:hypothetical protein [Polyangiaceae bacterium]
MTFVDQAGPEGGVASERRGGERVGRDAGCGWPLPARVVDHLVLDSPADTRAYWSSVSLVVAGLFVTKLLPCVDYPQHLALSDVARRLANPAAPEHASFQLNYFTYNGLFHFTVAWLSTLLPIELAGRLVVGGSLVAMAAAVVALVRVLRRPAVHAALFTPVLFSFSVGWGFANYVMATAIAAWALVFVARAAVRPTVASIAAVAALGLLCSFAHVLSMLILCATAAGLALEAAWRAAAPSTPRGTRLLRAAACAAAAVAPLAIGCLYCIAVYRQQYEWDPKMYRDPTIEGSSPSIVDKIVFFSTYATDLYRDGSDQLLLLASLGLVGWSAMLACKRRRAWDRPREDTPPILAPLVVLTVAYFATPMVLVGTHLIFPRISQWAVLGALLAMPRLLDGARTARAHACMRWAGLAAGANTVLHCAIFAWETGDASRIIDDLPPGGAATAVIWGPETLAFRNGTLTHLAAYYGARRHGRWAFAFARYLSVPVRFRPNSQPAWPARGWEFDADEYDARCKYARAFPLVIVKAPPELPPDASSEPLVRERLFTPGEVACSGGGWRAAQQVKLLSHRGHFWAFDTSGLADDGTF